MRRDLLPRRASLGRRWVALAAALTAALLIPASAAAAATASVAGTIDPATDPAAPQTAIISTPNCTGGYVAVAVHYNIIPLVPRTTGVHTITEVGGTGNIAVYVIEGQANPSELATNCIAASNTNPINLPVNLTAGTRYDLVVIDDTFTQEGLDYQLDVEADVAPGLGTADLGIGVTAPAGPHAPGDTVAFTATITNDGPQAGAGVTATITLPDGFDLASIAAVTADAGYSCDTDPVAGTLTCTVDQHAAGAEATIGFQATVAGGAAAGTYDVDASVASATIETNDVNNTAVVTIVVQIPPAPTSSTTTTTQPAAAPVVVPTFTG